MITVIATGFDANRKREPVRQAAAATSYETQGGVRRDYYAELEEQRRAVADDRPDDRGREAAAVRVEGRSVGEAVVQPVRRAAIDPDDLDIPSFLRRPK